MDEKGNVTLCGRCRDIIIRGGGNQATAEVVRQIAAQSLPPYKAPKYVVLLDTFPVTETGKIRKQEPLKTAIQAIKADLPR